MFRVLLAENGLVGRDAPVDAQTVIKDTDTAVGLGSIEVVALVLEDGGVAQYGKAVGKAAGYEELAVVVLGQFHSHMPAVGGTALTDIHGHIQYGTFDATHQFALCKGRTLEMQAAHHAIAGHALVILYKPDFTHPGVEVTLTETLKEITARIFKDSRFDNHHAFKGGLNDIHTYNY